MVQTRGAKVFQNSRQNGPKCIHVGSKNEAPRGTPSTFGGHFRGFWGSWRSWAAKCVLGGVLGRSWVGLGRVLGPSWGPSSASWKRLGCPRRPKNFAKTVQDASKMPPRQPKIRFSAKNVGKMSPWSSDGIFHSILVRFYLKNTYPNFEKSYWKNKHF